MATEEFAKDPGLSWSQLRAFEACAKLLSFNAAAASLNLTPAAVRYQVGLLEARLGVRLYDRQGGRLALTTIGTAFRGRIARPMQELAKACADASQSATAATLLLTVPPLFARQFLFGDRFLRWCDANFVKLDVTDSRRDLFGPDQIVAIRLGAEPIPDLSKTPVLAVKLVLAAAPAIVAKARVLEAAWWSKQNLLTPSVSEAAWEKVWLALDLREQMVPRHRRFSSYAAALEAACAGQGILLAALPFAEREFGAGRLARLSKIRISSPVGYSIVMRAEVAASRRGRLLRQRLMTEIRG
ncbi:MAG TPA: LysR family transcriptional regulator [Bradyrhizobium sp.]|jgi:LysR family glycine cleavage system transcriptional activator|nr:LysR family transcriptional regulator [Bradyrhizobium sp.]HTG02845.1 LysR family transcriptional regulator [Bradyrhizobium sp.]